MSVVASHLGSEEGTGANSQRALTGIIDLSVEGRGSKEGWDLMDSSLEFTIVSSNSLVASNSNRDGSICSCDLSFNFGDSVGQSRGSIWETSIWKTSIRKTSIGETTGRVCLSLSLSNVVNSR